ncbi:MAG: hypothetical protein C0520_01510, partial [Sphingopyxis sp.]|nr:hypothetical protein [Sphingopyxis sp.]
MTIESIDTAAPADGGAPAGGVSFRALAIGAVILLLIGIGGGGWAMSRWLAADRAPVVTTAADVPAPGGALTAVGDPAAGGQRALVVAPVDGANALAARVAELEQRLSRITLQAESASGNASRAEGLLVAFAVRRALDRGLSLGYLDAQLRLRFGDDQPNAVKTIIDTSRDPVTLEQ